MRSTLFVWSFLLWMVGLTLCAAPQVTLRERASAFPLITEKEASEIYEPYAWRLPVVPLSLDNREIFNFVKYPTLPSLFGGILTVRVLVVGDTVAVHQDLMDDFAKRCRTTLVCAPRRNSSASRACTSTGCRKAAVDRRWTNKSPCTFRDLRRPRSLSSTKDKRAVLCCANTTLATGATSSWMQPMRVPKSSVN